MQCLKWLGYIISDNGMHSFIEKGIGGVISYIDKRQSKANNKYIQSYDVDKPSKFIKYLDAKIYMVWQWANICSIVDLNG